MELTAPIVPPGLGDIPLRKKIALFLRGSPGLLCFLALNVADCILTWWAISIGGIEANWYRFLFSSAQIWAVLSLKMCIVGLFALSICEHKNKKFLFRLLNIGMGLVVAVNFIPVVFYLIGRFG